VPTRRFNRPYTFPWHAVPCLSVLDTGERPSQLARCPYDPQASQRKLIGYQPRKDAPFSTIILNMFFFDQFHVPIGLSPLPYIVL
jgi:hypothetical protein